MCSSDLARFFVEVMGMKISQVGVGDNPNYFLVDDAGLELALVNLQPHGVMGVERPAGEGQAAGGIKFGSLEVTEVRFPLFFRTHEFRPGSGGDGQYRGGSGCDLEFVAEIARTPPRLPARAQLLRSHEMHYLSME